MATNILFLPGLLGSNIGYFPPDGSPYQPVWMDLPAILNGELKYLQLSPNGSGPGPLAQGRTLFANGLFGPAYTPFLTAFNSLGFNIVALAFDWRQSILTVTTPATNAAIAKFGPQPFWIVAHSMGGLLARQIYALMVAKGLGAQVLGIIFICTPHYGSFEVVRLFNRLPLTYKAIVIAAGWKDFIAGGVGPTYIDAVLATWPGVYEVLPFAGSGPLFDSDPAQAASLYGIATYPDGNPYLETNLFTAAKVNQGLFAVTGPRGSTYCIAGVGQTTYYSLSGTAKLDSDDGYLATLLGDGEVTLAEASLSGVPVAPVLTTHGLACVDPGVWALVYALLVGAGGELAQFKQV